MLFYQVFSAPNYVDMSGNKGAFVSLYFLLTPFLPLTTYTTPFQIRVDAAGSLEYKQFEAQPHPDMKPMAYVNRGLAGMMM